MERIKEGTILINFVGNFQKGYVGEEADEVHLSRELEALGNTVRRIPRDAWREFVIEGEPQGKYDVPIDLKADANIICKWHHFFDESFIDTLRRVSGRAPVFYWVWDYMYDGGFPSWHISMAKSANLYLSNEGGLFDEYKAKGVKPYYFPMDVCDGQVPTFEGLEKKYDVIFTGSYLGQGDRIQMLTEINKEIPVKIFAWNHEEWLKAGFDAEPAVYGEEYNRLIAVSKVVLGFSVNAHCWGYWSNRVGKVLQAGGDLLYQYAPGMEMLPFHTFSTVEDCLLKIKGILEGKTDRFNLKGIFTSKARMAQMNILLHRYIDEGAKWNQLS